MNPVTIVLGIIGAIVFLFIFAKLVPTYRRVPPNRVMVLYGRGRTAFREDGAIDRMGVRLVTGGGTFVWPIVEEFQFLDLTAMTIVKKGDEVYTVDGVPIKLDWVAQVQIESTQRALITAARAFLGMPREQVIEVLAKTLSANFRAIVGQLTVENVHRDRDAFVRSVQDLVSDDMAAMGVKVISMGIEEITDDQGYFEAMAKPRIAAIKRDATIAEAEAEREARIKAALARQQAEQAELDTARSILEQREALELREVQKQKSVSLAQTQAEEEVQRKRAALVQQQQEVEVLTPARAQREATEIEADAESRKITIITQARAEATRKEAAAQAEALELAGRAEAEKHRALKNAEADGERAASLADADGKRAIALAQAEGTRANLLAEAEGKEKLAQATAAEGEINLRQAIAQLLIQAEVEKARAIAEALGGIGKNVRIVQFSGKDGSGPGGNPVVDVLKDIPELAAVINTKTEALFEQNVEQILARIGALLSTSRQEPPAPQADAAILSVKAPSDTADMEST